MLRWERNSTVTSSFSKAWKLHYTVRRCVGLEWSVPFCWLFSFSFFLFKPLFFYVFSNPVRRRRYCMPCHASDIASTCNTLFLFFCSWLSSPTSSRERFRFFHRFCLHTRLLLMCCVSIVGFVFRVSCRVRSLRRVGRPVRAGRTCHLRFLG